MITRLHTYDVNVPCHTTELFIDTGTHGQAVKEDIGIVVVAGTGTGILVRHTLCCGCGCGCGSKYIASSHVCCVTPSMCSSTESGVPKDRRGLCGCVCVSVCGCVLSMVNVTVCTRITLS